jgi:tripartite-type tricarboxylate transporter receptor subunit TctC
LAERGHRLNFDVWQGLVAAKNASPQLVHAVENALNQVTQMADFKTTVTAQTGATVAFMGSRDWGEKWRQEDQAFSEIIARLKKKP